MLITVGIFVIVTRKMLRLRVEMLEHRRELKFRRFVYKELPKPPKQVDWDEFEANVGEYGH